MSTNQKIAEAITLLSQGGVGKKNWNDQQKFWFRGIDDILSTLSPVLSKTGLMILPTVKSIESTEFVSGNQKQTKFNRVVVTVEYSITSNETEPMGGTYTVVFAGEAMDTGDKATAKALSMAYKQMAIQTFCIPVVGEDDADAESPGHEPEEEQIRSPKRIERPQEEAQEAQPEVPTDQSRPSSAGEVAFVRRKLSELNRDEAAALRWLNIDAWDKMTSGQFLKIRDYLGAKARG